MQLNCLSPQIETAFYRKEIGNFPTNWTYNNHILSGPYFRFVKRSLKAGGVASHRIVLIAGTSQGRLSQIQLHLGSIVTEAVSVSTSDCPHGYNHLITVSGFQPDGKEVEWMLALPSERNHKEWVAALIEARGSSESQEACGDAAVLRDLALKMHAQLRTCDKIINFNVFRKCFAGSCATIWISNHLKCSLSTAVSIGNRLINGGFIHHVQYEHIFCDKKIYYQFSIQIQNYSDCLCSEKGLKKNFSMDNLSMLQVGTTAGGETEDELTEQNWMDACRSNKRQTNLMSQAVAGLQIYVETLNDKLIINKQQFHTSYLQQKYSQRTLFALTIAFISQNIMFTINKGFYYVIFRLFQWITYVAILIALYFQFISYYNNQEIKNVNIITPMASPQSSEVLNNATIISTKDTVSTKSQEVPAVSPLTTSNEIMFQSTSCNTSETSVVSDNKSTVSSQSDTNSASKADVVEDSSPYNHSEMKYLPSVTKWPNRPILVRRSPSMFRNTSSEDTVRNGCIPVKIHQREPHQESIIEVNTDLFIGKMYILIADLSDSPDEFFRYLRTYT